VIGTYAPRFVVGEPLLNRQLCVDGNSAFPLGQAFALWTTAYYLGDFGGSDYEQGWPLFGDDELKVEMKTKRMDFACGECGDTQDAEVAE
jgi:hypothetical protein